MIQLTDVDLIIPPIRKGDEARSLLMGISLTLSERRVVVIGVNGSGKSSLLRLLSSMRQPTPGTVSVKGHDVVEEPRKVRQFAGFIFTSLLAQLLMSIPVEDLTFSLGHLPGKERMSRVQQILDERGLGHLAHQSIHDLPGGERQMVALASVLAVRPKVIVADEPTTLPDLRNRPALHYAPAELEQQVVYSIHDIGAAADADRVIVIEGGRVTVDGEPGEVIVWYEGVIGVTG